MSCQGYELLTFTREEVNVASNGTRRQMYHNLIILTTVILYHQGQKKLYFMMVLENGSCSNRKDQQGITTSLEF